MGWLEDSVEEFRKLPPAGKLAVGGAAVGVAFLAYAQYRASAGQSSASAASGQPVTGAFPGGLGTGSVTTTDNAGGAWTISGAPSIGLFNGTGLPERSVTPPTTDLFNGSGLPPRTVSGSAGSMPNSAGGGVTFAPASAAAASSSFAAAVAHVNSSASAPAAPKPAPAPMPNIQNPTAAQSRAHRGTSFIPTTIRPLPTPGRGRSA